MKEKPDFDYAGMPHLSREGFKGGNNRFYTEALFFETSDKPQLVMWTLGPEEMWSEVQKRWIPSAMQVYINATDEYDALRKLIGSVKQWELLKQWEPATRPKFIDYLQDWALEQAYVQKSRLRATLMSVALSGIGPTVSAARTVLQLIDGKPVGRPKKEKAEKEPETAEIDKDHDRVLKFKR